MGVCVCVCWQRTKGWVWPITNHRDGTESERQNAWRHHIIEYLGLVRNEDIFIQVYCDALRTNSQSAEWDVGVSSLPWSQLKPHLETEGHKLSHCLILVKKEGTRPPHLVSPVSLCTCEAWMHQTGRRASRRCLLWAGWVSLDVPVMRQNQSSS